MLHEKLINVGNQKLKIVIHKTAAIPEVSSYEKNSYSMASGDQDNKVYSYFL